MRNPVEQGVPHLERDLVLLLTGLFSGIILNAPGLIVAGALAGLGGFGIDALNQKLKTK